MQYIIQVLILLFGFVFGYFMYELYRYRAGGVIAVPILVLYSFEAPIAILSPATGSPGTRGPGSKSEIRKITGFTIITSITHRMQS